MINLKISGDEEINISIEKCNKIKVVNEELYLDLYRRFYEKDGLFIQNKEVNKKDFVFIDISSVAGIISQFEFNRKSLIYEYLSIKYGDIDINQKNQFYNSFLEQVKQLEDSLNITLSIIPEDNIDKVLLQNIDIKIDWKNISDTLNVVINSILKNNISKIYIILYNSQICSISPLSDNYYLFDINPFLEASEYNILIADQYYEFEIKRLIEYLENKWPVPYGNGEILELINQYFQLGIHSKCFITKVEKLYLIAVILRKTYNLKQEILCDKIVINSIIKSFIDTF